MHACFVDEAGDLGALGNPPLPNDQPVLAIGGLFVDVANLASLTDKFLDLKHRYFPGLPYPSTLHLDRILPEIKGADVRSNATPDTIEGRCGPYLAKVMRQLGYRTFGIGRFHSSPSREPLGYDVHLHSEEL